MTDAGIEKAAALPPLQEPAQSSTTGTCRRPMRAFIVSSLIFALFSLYLAHDIPLKYTGETKFSRRSDAAAKMSGQGSESFDTVKLTLEHDLLGREAVESVVRTLGLDRGLPHNTQGELTREGEKAKQEIIEGIQKGTKLTWEVRSADVDLVSVSVTHHDPTLAQKIPDELVKGYINRTSEEIPKRLTASRDFLRKEEETCQSRLSSLENERIAFETEHASMMPESPGAVQRRIQELGTQIATLGRQKQAALERVGAARAKLEQLKAIFPEAASSAASQPTTQPATRPASLPASKPAPGPTTRVAPADLRVVKEEITGPNPELKLIEERMRDLRYKLEDLIDQGLDDRNSAVKNVKSRIAQYKKLLEETPKEAVLQTVYLNPRAIADQPSDRLGALALTDARGALNAAIWETKALDDELAPIQKSRDEVQALMANFAPTRQKYVEITKKITEQQAELASWQGRLSEVQMSLAAEVAKKRTHLEAVQAANEQFVPISPRLSHFLLIVLGFSVVFGALCAALPRIVEIAARRAYRSRRARNQSVRPSRGGRTGFIIFAVVLLLATCVAIMNLTLRLEFPDMYAQWRASPAAFLYQYAVQPVISWLGSLV